MRQSTELSLKAALSTFALLSFFATCVFAHQEWVYPPPRMGGSFLTYPCGPTTYSNINVKFWDAGQPNSTLSPGPLEVWYLETQSHNGAPNYFAISYDDDTHYDEIVLKAHVPHHNAPSGNPLAIVLEIPDIDCPRCSLQLVSVLAGSSGCCYFPPSQQVEGYEECGRVWLSCSNIAITGTQDPATYAAEVHNNPRYFGLWTGSGGDYISVNTSAHGPMQERHFLENPDQESFPYFLDPTVCGQDPLPSPIPTPTPPPTPTATPTPFPTSTEGSSSAPSTTPSTTPSSTPSETVASSEDLSCGVDPCTGEQFLCESPQVCCNSSCNRCADVGTACTEEACILECGGATSLGGVAAAMATAVAFLLY